MIDHMRSMNTINRSPRYRLLLLAVLLTCAIGVPWLDDHANHYGWGLIPGLALLSVFIVANILVVIRAIDLAVRVARERAISGAGWLDLLLVAVLFATYVVWTVLGYRES